MKTLFAGLLLLLMLPFTVSQAETDTPRDPYKYFFNETWGEYKDELATAKTQGKKAILVFFELDECPFCHYMKEHILSQPSVQAYFRENFLNFAIDIEGAVEIVDFQGVGKTQREFAEKDNRVRATPVFAFFDLEGNRIAKFIGRTADAEEFMLLGKYVAEGHYKEMPFLKYKREQQKASNS